MRSLHDAFTALAVPSVNVVRIFRTTVRVMALRTMSEQTEAKMEMMFQGPYVLLGRGDGTLTLSD